MWVAFKNFLAGIKNLIVSFIIFLIRKSLWIVSFALAGMLIGYLLYSFSRPFYTSSLEGNTGGIYNADHRNYLGGVDNSVVIDHVNKLNLAISKPSLLANYLGMGVERVKEIRSIKAYYGIDVNKDYRPDYIDDKDEYNPLDTAQNRVPSFIHIRVSVYDENILPELRKGLFRYINNNAYIQELFNLDRLQKHELINELEKEIQKIEEFQQARLLKESNIEKGAVVNLQSEPEPKLFYQDKLNLYNRKQLLEKNLKISDEIIVVVQDFTPLENEERPLLIYVIVLGGSMAVLGFFCALLWQYRKRIWKLIREDSNK
jgi:hypothetical protein